MMYLFFYHAKSAVIAYQAVSQVPSYVLEALFSQHMTTFTVTERRENTGRTYVVSPDLSDLHHYHLCLQPSGQNCSLGLNLKAVRESGK